nr:serine/threonine-protein kinase ATM isoform X1 [Tanacetum cinerariifolium]
MLLANLLGIRGNKIVPSSLLVYAIIYYCNEPILRLCHDVVLLKAKVAELLLSNVMVDLAKRKNLDIDLCKLISKKVLEEIVVESNKLTRSVQVILDALSKLRLCHVMKRVASVPSKIDGSKLQTKVEKNAADIHELVELIRELVRLLDPVPAYTKVATEGKKESLTQSDSALEVLAPAQGEQQTKDSTAYAATTPGNAQWRKCHFLLSFTHLLMNHHQLRN